MTCLYTWTANEDFILDRGSGPFVVASPCSGHGAKFAPLLGEIIADLAAGKPPPDPRFTLAAHLRRLSQPGYAEPPGYARRVAPDDADRAAAAGHHRWWPARRAAARRAWPGRRP